MNVKVKECLKNLFTQNIGLKLAAFVIAVAMWFVVVNATDPAVTQRFSNVSVVILNEDIVTSEGKVLEIVDNSNVLSSVVIKAPRSVIREFGSTNAYIYATADIRSLSADGTSVPIYVTTTKYSDKVENITLSEESVYVKIENRKSMQLPIKSTISGDLESGYVLGKITQAANQVRISGPESVVNSVKTASVDVQVTGFTEKISTSADIVLYDEDGNEVDDDNLTLNISAVKVDVEILATKKIPITYSVSGIPAEGYERTGEIEADMDEVAIAGTPEDLEKLSSLDIPADALNVNGMTTSLHAVINLSNYLPSGISFVDSSFYGKVNVVVHIEGYEEETYSVYLRNIEVINIPDGFSNTEWSSKKDYIEFTLVGLAQNLEKVQLSELHYSVDFSDYELMNEITGFKAKTVYELPLLMDLPEGVSIKEPVSIGVTLVK